MVGREKLRLADQKVLFVCVSERWDTISRKALSDAITFRDMGGESLLCCLKGSYLDQEAHKHDIKCHYLLSAGRGMAKVWRLHRQLKPLMLQYAPDLVHAYNYETVLPLGIILKRLPRIPLLYTCNEDVSFRYRPFWHDYAVLRADLILAFSTPIRERLMEVLPLGPRRVQTIGAGLEASIQEKLKAPPENEWRLCTFVSRDESHVESVMPAIMALGPLTEELKRRHPEKRLVLTFLSDVSWYEHRLYGELKRLVLERGLEGHVAFHSRSLGSQLFADQHLFVGLGVEEPFGDLELLALFHRTPVLLPRTSARQQLVRRRDFGETYLPGDVRELRDKVVGIFGRYSSYLTEIESARESLAEHHHFEHYAQELYQHYEKLMLQRLRFSLKKNRPSAPSA